MNHKMRFNHEENNVGFCCAGKHLREIETICENPYEQGPRIHTLES